MFTEDFSAFFDVANGFAVSATLNGVAVSGVFDNGTAIGAVGMMGMVSTSPSFVLPTASVPADPIGKTLVIGSSSYLVAANEPDGTGVTTLLLEKSA